MQFFWQFSNPYFATYVGRIPKHWYQMILGAGYPNEVQVSVVTFSHLTTATGLSASDKKMREKKDQQQVSDLKETQVSS